MIELNRIERAIQTVALLIQETGEMYWPILERLELERDLRQSRQIRLSNYLASSQKTLPPRGRGLSRSRRWPNRSRRIRSSTPAAIMRSSNA